MTPPRRPPAPPSRDKISAQEQAALFDSYAPAPAPQRVAEAGSATPPRAAGSPSGESRAANKIDDKLGHRERLRERFRTGGTDALPDYELLEMILFRVFPRGDTKPLAKALLRRFGTFAEVIAAPAERILEVEGAGQRVADELRLIKTASDRLLKGQVTAKTIVGSWLDLLAYLRGAQGFEDREQFRILFLDKKNQIIRDEVQGRGTVDHTPVYVREVVKRALELSASAIILVHNHPSGDPTPSRADIDMTKLIADAARPFGVVLHDHIIVGRNGHASFRALKLL